MHFHHVIDLDNMLTIDIKNKIRQLSLDNINEEVCGLILSIDNIYQIYPCKNIARNKLNHFILNPLDYINAEKLGKIVALYHSQDDEFPSIMDDINSYNHEIISIIYGKKTNKFNISSPIVKEYLNRDFNIKENNCYTLLRDYLKDKKGINLNTYSNIDDDWFLKNPSFISEHIIEDGGIEIDFKDIKQDDILFFGKNKQHINHIGIWIGNGLFLHHPRLSKSIIENLNDHYKNKLVMVVRHRDICQQN